MKGGDDEDRPKRRETRPFGPLVIFFFFFISLFFFVLNGSFILCTGYKLQNTRVKSGDDENGPLVCVFIFFLLCFTNTNYYI